MIEPTLPCIGCEGTGITHDNEGDYSGYTCPDCDGTGAYEQPIKEIEGVYQTRHRAGCRYDETYQKAVAEGLNPHRHLSGCQCDDCIDSVIVNSLTESGRNNL